MKMSNDFQPSYNINEIYELDGMSIKVYQLSDMCAVYILYS